MNRKRAARRVRYFGNYILFCFILTLLCVRVIAGDCIRHAQCGAFTYLPELNLAQYAPESTTELQNERLAKYRESLEYLKTAERSGTGPSEEPPVSSTPVCSSGCSILRFSLLHACSASAYGKARAFSLPSDSFWP